MTDALAIARQEADAEFAVAVEWHDGLRDLVIQNDEQQEQVAAVLRRVKSKYNAIEGRRKEITVPFNQALKSVNDLFRPPREKLEAIEKLLKQKIAVYLKSKAEANFAAIQAASTAATPAEATAALATVAPVAPPQGISVRPVWKFEVVDPDVVPRELCSPDPKKIAEALQAKADKYGQPDLIPGVRVFQEPVVTARSGGT